MTFSLVTICCYLYLFCLSDFYHLSKSLLGVVRWVYSLLSPHRCHIWKGLRSSASEQEKVWRVLCRHIPADIAAAQRHSRKQAAHLKGSSALVLLLVETESAWENGLWHTGIKYAQNELSTNHNPSFSMSSFCFTRSCVSDTPGREVWRWSLMVLPMILKLLLHHLTEQGKISVTTGYK